MVANIASARQRSTSITEFAEMHGVSPCTVRRRIADGTIQAIRIGRLIRIPLDQTFGSPVTVR